MRSIATCVLAGLMAVLLVACGGEAPKQPQAKAPNAAAPAQPAAQPAAQPEAGKASVEGAASQE